MSPETRHLLESDFRAVREEIALGIVETTAQERRRFLAAWKLYLSHTAEENDALLHHQTNKQKIDLLAAFAHHVRHGGISRQKQCVCAKTVKVALRAVTAELELDGQPNPLVTSQGKYVQAIKQLLARYRRLDPPVQRRIAVPLDVPQFLLENALATQDDRMLAVADSCIIAFFFLLRSCEYTTAPESNRRQTIPFRWKDVQLWEGTKRLSIFSSYTDLCRRCTAVTLCLANQKTGVRGSPITHHRLPKDHPAVITCPIMAILRRLSNACLSRDFQNHIISSFVTPNGELHSISARTITNALKKSVRLLKLEEVGVHASLVSRHSLQSGGATVMHLNGIPDTVIKKMG